MPKRRHHSDLDAEYDTGSEESSSRLSSSRSARRPRLNLAQDNEALQSSQDSSDTTPPSGSASAATIHLLSRDLCPAWDSLTSADQEIISRDWKRILSTTDVIAYPTLALLPELGLCDRPSHGGVILANHPDIWRLAENLRSADRENPRPYYELMSHNAFASVRVAKVKPEDVQPVPLPSDVYTEGPSPYKSKAHVSTTELRQDIKAALDQFNEQFKAFADGKKLSDRFGTHKGAEFVNLLLQELGLDPSIVKRAKDFFTIEKNVLFANVSGAGKSRIALECLLLAWGFYISFTEAKGAQVAAESEHGRGSTDLQWVMNEMPLFSEWHAQPTSKEAFDANKAVADRCFAIILLARLSVLLRFLQSVPSWWNEKECRLEWVILQADPLLAGCNRLTQGVDIFRRIAECGRHCDIETLKVEITYLWSEIAQTRWFARGSGAIGKEHFIVFWDEAQVGLGGELSNHFCSETSIKIKRPPLSVLLKASTEYAFLDRYMVCGTGLSLGEATRVLESSAFKDSPTVTLTGAGSFDADGVEEYLTKHLDRLLAWDSNPSHAWLLERCKRWFPGRPRTTAAFVEGVLIMKPASLHRFFDRYFSRITDGFTPNDAGDFLALEPELTLAEATYLDTKLPIVNWSNFDALPDAERLQLMRDMTNASLRFLIGSKHTNVRTKSVIALEIGLGRIHKDNMENLNDPGPISIDELVALAAIIKHFAQEDRMDWIHQLSNAMLNNQMNGYVLEWQVIFLFLQHFGSVYTAIGHVFELSDLPEWSWLKDRKVTLVGVKHMGGSDYRSFSVNWDKAPHLPFGYDASSGDKMASALERCNGTAFFRPDPFCHPDVLLTLRDEYGNLIGVLVQAKLSSGKGSIVSHISKDVFDKAVSSLEPTNIYSRKSSEAPLGEDGTPVKRPSHKVKNRVLQALDKMLGASNGDTVAGDSSLPRRNPRRSTRHQERRPPKWLRVLAIGPASADRYFGEEARKPHPYPLILVKNERMVELFGANWWNSTRQNVSVDPF